MLEVLPPDWTAEPQTALTAEHGLAAYFGCNGGKTFSMLSFSSLTSLFNSMNIVILMTRRACLHLKFKTVCSRLEEEEKTVLSLEISLFRTKLLVIYVNAFFVVIFRRSAATSVGF